MTIRRLIADLSVPIAFYFTFRWVGIKPALVLVVFATLAQVLAHFFFKWQLSGIVMTASGFTVVFGIIDLSVQSPRFFRFEAFLQNFIIATAFLMTLFTSMPMVTWVIRSLPIELRNRFLDMSPRYLRNLTLAWVIYLYFKAFLFFYLAFHTDLATLVMLRSFIGGSTLLLMVLGERIVRRYLLR